MTKVQKLEERISKRMERINNYQEKIKKEKILLKKDEENLAHIKYEDVIKALVENKVNPNEIMQMVNEVVSEDEEQKNSINSFNENERSDSQ